MPPEPPPAPPLIAVASLPDETLLCPTVPSLLSPPEPAAAQAAVAQQILFLKYQRSSPDDIPLQAAPSYGRKALRKWLGPHTRSPQKTAAESQMRL